MKNINKIIIGVLFLSSHMLYAVTSNYFATPDGTGNTCSQASPCSLSTALSTAVDFDTVYMGAGNYTSDEYEVAFIESSITLLGGWDATTTTSLVRNPDIYVSVIDGEDTRGGIMIEDDNSVVIDGVTISNAKTDESGAGLFVENSNLLTLKNIEFSNNNAVNYEIDYINGGAAYVEGGMLNIENCTFTNNTAIASISGYGGALAIFETNTTIKSSIFRDNRAYTNSVLKFKGVSSTSLNTLLIEDSTFINHGITAPNGYEIIKIENADIEAHNNIFTQNLSHRGNLIEIYSSNLIFTANIISNNQSQKIPALFLHRVTNLEVSNNIIVDNSSTSSVEDFPAIHVIATTQRGLFTHNTIANNDTDFALLMGDGINGIEPMDNISFINNIIMSEGVGIHVSQYVEIDIDSTLWYGPAHTEGAGTINATHSFVGSADFVDAPNGNYHIGANSVAKDVGVSAGVIADIDGDARPQGSGYDIGADEFVNSLTSPAIIMYLLN